MLVLIIENLIYDRRRQEMEVDKIICGDCLEVMRDMPDFYLTCPCACGVISEINLFKEQA